MQNYGSKTLSSRLAKLYGLSPRFGDGIRFPLGCAYIKLKRFGPSKDNRNTSRRRKTTLGFVAARAAGGKKAKILKG